MKSKEDEHLEFKEAKTQFDSTKLQHYCVALANEGGGKLILGVTDKKPRQVVGSQAFLNLDETKSKIFNKLRFRVEADEVLHPNGRVIVFDVPARPSGHPYNYDGKYLMRVGEELTAMSPDKLRKIFDEGKPDFLSQIAERNLSSDDVIRLLDTQIYFDLLKIPYPAERGGVLERFESAGLIIRRADRFEITNLGAVLFAKDLNSFETVKGKVPRVVVFEGKSKIKTRTDIFGRKGYVVGFENLVEYINTQLPSNQVIGKAFREDVKMFPEIAIRELVANALVHQDFEEQGIFVTIEIYSDRIEVRNPGLSPISTDRLIDSDKSRNETIAELMRRLRICERQGSGIDKVISSIETWQLPAPDFRNGEKHFTALLFSHVPLDEMSKKDKIRACYQHCSLKFMMNERMTNQTLRERFDLVESKADVSSQIIRNTIDAGKIKLEDPESTSRRYARYVPYWA